MRNNTPVPVPCAYGSVRAYIFTSPKITKIYKAHIVNTIYTLCRGKSKPLDNVR